MGAGGEKRTIRYRYTLTFEDGSAKIFDVVLDADTLSLIQEPKTPPPEWTRLAVHKCPNCPLEEGRHPHCPVAVSIAHLVEAFRPMPSFAAVDVRVEAPNRTYTKRGSLQEAATPLVGLHMVTSGCPILGKLRPMVEMHLPFMNADETMYRTIAMYLMAQYFRQREGQSGDWELTGLFAHLHDIHRVNVAFCERLRSIETKDASVNAVVRLATIGDFPSRRATQHQLRHLHRVLEQSGWGKNA